MASGNKGKGTVVDAPRGNFYYMRPEELTIIGIDTDHTSRKADDPKGHPYFDERAFLPRKAHKVAYAKAFGIERIIKAVKDGEQSIVLYGRQCTLDLRAANAELVKEGQEPLPIRVMFEKGNEETLQRIMIAENSLTEDEDAITEAEKLESYFGRHGETPKAKQAMLLVHGSPKSIENKRSLLNLHDKIQSAIKKGVITPTACLPLAGLPKDEQLAKFEALMADPSAQTRTGRIGAAAVRQATGKTVAPRPKKRVLTALSESKDLPSEVRAVVSWVLGEIDEDAAVRRIPGLRAVLDTIKVKPATKCSACSMTKAEAKAKGSTISGGKTPLCDTCAGNRAIAAARSGK